MSQLIHLYLLSDTRYILRYRSKVTVPRARFSLGIHGAEGVSMFTRQQVYYGADKGACRCLLSVDRCCMISMDEVPLVVHLDQVERYATRIIFRRNDSLVRDGSVSLNNVIFATCRD